MSCNKSSVQFLDAKKAEKAKWIDEKPSPPKATGKNICLLLLSSRLMLRTVSKAFNKAESKH